MPGTALRADFNERTAPPRIFDAGDQQSALRFLRDEIQKGAAESNLVQELARVITARVKARDDLGELTAIYNAVKFGRADLKPWGLSHGFRYMADQRYADSFFGADRIIRMLQRGANGGDCDDFTVLIGSLAVACGFRVGARGYGHPGSAELVHVYPIALMPKDGPWNEDAQGRPDEKNVVGLDATVPSARVGWQPPPGFVKTALTE